MTMIIKRQSWAKAFETETGEHVAALRGKRFWGSAVLVLDANGDVAYEADREMLPGCPSEASIRYVIRRGGAVIASGMPEYGAGADHHALSGPPRAMGLWIDMPDGRWHARRDQHNGVDIQAASAEGCISPFFAMRAQRMTLPDGADPLLWIAVYALVHDMMHEDDRPIV